MPQEEIIVLANSLKMRGRCVAGISLRSGRWVRPVSNFEHGELYPFNFKLGGWQPRLLEIVRFEYEHDAPEPEQPENVLLADQPWEPLGDLDPADAYERLTKFLSEGPDLLGNRDRGVPAFQAEAGVESSLALVESDAGVGFEVRVRQRPQARINFNLEGQFYDLPVTDPALKVSLLSRGAGDYQAEEVGLTADHVLVTVSLGPSYRGTNWKLAAACFGAS